MKRSIFSLLFFTIFLQTYAYKKQEININVNGQQRNMVVFTPTRYPTSRRCSLSPMA